MDKNGILPSLRRKLAPAGSRRERLARATLGPLMQRLRAHRDIAARKALARRNPERYVTVEESPAQRMRVLPPNPRILLIKLDGIGDFLLSLAAFEMLRQAFPDAQITLVCSRWATAWADTIGFFDRVVPFDFPSPRRENGHDTAEAGWHAYDALELGAFDLAVDLRHDSDTRPLLARTSARFRAGYYAPPAQGGEALDIALPLAESVVPEAGACRPLHAGLRVTALAAVVAASFARRNEVLAHRLRAGTLPGELTAPYAIVAPGAGIKIREWPLERMIAVARMLHRDYGLQIVISGAAADIDSGRRMVAALGEDAAVDLTGRLDLAQLPEMFAQARLYVGNDTGTTHLAASLGTPTVAIMSGLPTLEVWPPLGAAVRVIAGRPRCAPCHILRSDECPFDIACLKAVKTGDAETACRDLLAKTLHLGKDR